MPQRVYHLTGPSVFLIRLAECTSDAPLLVAADSWALFLEEVADMTEQGLVERTNDGWQLTKTGSRVAQVLRVNRNACRPASVLLAN